MENPLINVLIVDDEKIVREGIKHLIDWTILAFVSAAKLQMGRKP